MHRCLDKAAIIEDNISLSEQKGNPWRLATVTKLEELKLILNAIPIWLTSLTFGVCVSQSATFFVKQAAVMNLNITHSFKIPPASIYCLGGIAMIISVTFYEKILVPLLMKSNGNERGLSILQRIGIGMVMVIAAMVVSALVERKRLGIVKEEKSSISMSAFWLVPQYMILGFADGFTLVGLQEYFYEEVPDSMRSLGIAFYLSVIGVGSFLSNALITVVDHITEKSGKSWIGKDLNISRLDNFYWILAAINAVNLCLYILVARSYNYKTVQRIVSEANGNNESIT